LLWALDDARLWTLQTLAGLDLESRAVVDWAPPGGEGIGTLLYHVAAIEASWLYDEVLQAAYPPEVQAMFPEDVRDDQGRLTPVASQTLGTHLRRLEQIRERLLAAFRDMTVEDFRRPRSLADYDVTPEWVIHHLMQHEAEHRSRIDEVRQAAERALDGAVDKDGA